LYSRFFCARPHHRQKPPGSIKQTTPPNIRRPLRPVQTHPPYRFGLYPPQISQASPTPEADKTEDESQEWNGWNAIAPPTWSNWVLAAFAVLAAIIGLGTLGKINAQVRETVIALRINRVAASAAKRSADAAEKSLVYLERPWIFIDIVRFDGFQRGTPIPSVKAAGLINGMLRWSFRNYGRSPALIIEGGVRIRTLDKPLPEPPDYGKAELVVPIPIAPNKLTRTDTGWLMDADDYQRVIQDKASFVFYGFIRYRDTFQSEIVHTSRWCAVLKLPAFRLAGEPDWYWAFEGPPSYIEYT
jgi:hypothetical protein